MRDPEHPSHSVSPLYKGISEENVRDEVKTSTHNKKFASALILLSRHGKIEGAFVSIYT